MFFTRTHPSCTVFMSLELPLCASSCNLLMRTHHLHPPTIILYNLLSYCITHVLFISTNVLPTVSMYHPLSECSTQYAFVPSTSSMYQVPIATIHCPHVPYLTRTPILCRFYSPHPIFFSRIHHSLCLRHSYTYCYRHVFNFSLVLNFLSVFH